MKYKVVYNTAVSGGLHLSDEAIAWLKERGLTIEFDSGQSKGFVTNIPRHNYLLVECIETLGEVANGPENGWVSRADLKVAHIHGKLYYIDDHDGAGEEVIDITKTIDASIDY